MLALSEAAYIDKVLTRFSMKNSKKSLMPTCNRIVLSNKQCPMTPQEEEDMRYVPYTSAIGSFMYVILCTNPGPKHWIAVKHILKYLRRTRDYMLVYSSEDLKILRYTNSDFQGDRDSKKLTPSVEL